jgi:hypothetical protein
VKLVKVDEVVDGEMWDVVAKSVDDDVVSAKFRYIGTYLHTYLCIIKYEFLSSFSCFYNE